MIKPAKLISCRHSRVRRLSFLSALFLSTTTGVALAGDVCEGFGPQTPRDISQIDGSNPQVIPLAPDAQQMNLCNIHFHQNAEHKAPEFSIFAGSDKNAGYQCAISKNLTKKELRPVKKDVCQGLQPGDTIEVHWVHTSCSVSPGPGLGSCLVNDVCINPTLRVEAQVFTLVNDRKAANFNDYVYDMDDIGDYHQAKSLPDNTGEPVEFIGSTTGPSYSQQSCSPLGVTWSVRPSCQKLNIHSLAKWCKNNIFEEDHAHGVRKLVTDKRLLSPIE